MDPSVNYIINELTHGMELAMHLKSILSSQPPPTSQTKQVLIQEIISSYDRTMFMLNQGGEAPPPVLSMISQPESSVSINEIPRSQDFKQQEEKVLSKKRKAMPTWQEHVRISTNSGLEGNTDDGYSWRKYGQKTILGAKFPRSYYRCTYRHAHNCMARKQVQRTDEDPTVFDITYRGHHTCNPSAKPESPEKLNNHPPKSGEMLSNLKENLRVTTSDLDAIVPCSFSFPSASFGTIENYQQFSSNYFTEWGNDFPNLS